MRNVVWVRRHDRRQRFLAVPFQECPSPPMTSELRRASERDVQVVTDDGRRLAGSGAVLFILEEVGWHPRFVRLARMPPLSWSVEMAYRLVVRFRPLLARL